MKKADNIKRSVCLLAVVLMMGACGKAETTDTSAADTTAAESSVEETSAAESTEKESEEETKQEETKEESSEESTKAEETEAPEREESSVSSTEATSKETEASSEAAPETSPETVPETTAPQSTGKGVKEIYGEITQKVALVSPMVVPDEYIANYYGIDLGSLDEYVFSMSEQAISAETVAILKAKDAGSTGTLSAALQTVIDQKRSEMENYLPDQFQIVDRSTVQVKGNYVYLVISDKADAINQIIQAGIQ